MNLFVTHCDSSMADCAVLMLKSLKRCSVCKPHLFDAGIGDAQTGELLDIYPGREFIQVLTRDQFEGRIATCKVECVYEAVSSGATTCIAADVDMLFKHDPFALFENDGDVFVTRRPNNWKHPINGGLWAFRCNEAGQNFIRFYNEQVHKKDWPPYRKYLKKFDHFDEVNWRIGQDFLNVIAKTPLPFPCKVTVLGPEWNWLHDSGAKKKPDPKRQAEQDALFEMAKKAYRKALADPAIHVLHFKAKMKSEMPAFAKEMGLL